MALSIVALAIFTTISVYHLTVAFAAVPLPVGSRRSSHFVPHDLECALGAVSSLSHECSQAGIEVLQRGGNAADAMIAVEFCVGVIGMQSTGLGGGGFMLVRGPNGSEDCVDYRETAPAAATQDMFNNDDDASLWSGLASGVPGVLRGLEYLHKSYATLPWRDLLQPAIHLAREGFIVNADLTRVFSEVGTFLVDNPAWAIDFAPNGTLVGIGDTLTRKRYADLLETIAEEGPDVFYNGHIANTTISALQAANGTMTLEDLSEYSIVIREPVKITYRDFTLTTCGAPTGGAVVLSVMKTVEGYEDFGQPSSLNISTHRFDEAMRFGYGARTELGDPSFVANVTQFQEEMLLASTAETIRSKISDEHTLPISAYNPNGIESLETPGTSEVVTADGSGMTISLTSTINLWFGSKIIVPETGLIMNNEMNDFSIPGASNAFGYIPSPANYIEPGKRPLSSMSPIIVDWLSSGKFYYALGGVGGSYIITAVAQSLWNVLDRNMTLQQALDAPRFHDQLIPNYIEFEYSYDNATVAFMAERGHNVTWAGRECDVMALRRHPNGTFEAASDPDFTAAGAYVV